MNAFSKHGRNFARWGVAGILVLFLLGTFFPVLVQAASKRAASAYAGQVVISEFRTTGPDKGNDEFIEIFNRTNDPVDMGGWVLERSSSSGTTKKEIGDAFPAGFTLAAGQYYLVTGEAYSGSVVGDLEEEIGVADNGGLALLDGAGNIVDAVGMTDGMEYSEGHSLGELSSYSNQGYQRGENGCVDTDDNAADFSLLTPSDPQNSTDTPVRCLKVKDVTSTASSGIYAVTDPPTVIEITVEFTSKVNVDTSRGTPTLLLETGSNDRDATYSGGSGTDTLIFNYIVQDGDVSADLDYVGTDSLSLNGGTIIGAVGNADLTLPEPGVAGSLSDNRNIVIDNGVDPTTLSFTRQEPLSKITNADELTFRVIFSEPVKNVDKTDFSVTVNPKSGIATAAVDTVTPVNAPEDASVYDVKVTGADLIDLEGTVGLNFVSTASAPPFNIVDGALHPVPDSDPTTEETYTVDNVPPEIDTFTKAVGQDENPDATPVNFTVVFKDEIDPDSFTGADISQSVSGAGAASLITWDVTDTGDQKTFTVSAIRIGENGDISPRINANSINDLAGNLNPTNLDCTDTVNFLDNTPPTVTVNQASGQDDPTSSLPIEFTVNFSEPIISSIFTTADITQNGTATGITWSITNASDNDDQTFKLFVTKITEPGTLQPSIAANRVTDWVGNDNLASTSTDNTVTYNEPTTPEDLTILINEVAWSGTAANTSHEWIELYNSSNQQYDLSAGWKLISTDYSINIELTGIISPGGYYLLEDTTDENDPEKNPISDIDADQIYSGSMSNTGEYLKLLAPDGTVIDTANKDGGYWPAGNASPNYGSMERRGVLVDSATAWITNTGIVRNGHDAENNEINGTPRQPNWAFSVTPTVAPTRTKTPIPPTRTPTPYPFQSVVLNEVLPRPGHDWNEDGVVDVNDEFIEIINRGNSAVSLGGWKIDDEYNLGSSPYSLPTITLGVGERIAIFGYSSHISLSDGGDTVRLIKNGGAIADVITYPVVKAADQSWCRYPENGFWNTDCFPTPNEANTLKGVFPAGDVELARQSCLVPDTAPDAVRLIECGLFGMSIYDRAFWGEPLPGYWLTGQSKYLTWFR